MPDRLTTFFQLIELQSDRWRADVGNPCLGACTDAYVKFEETLNAQSEADKAAGELFVAAASVCTGSLLTASLARVTLPRVVRRTIIVIGGRQLATTYARLYRTIAGTEAITFAIGKIYEELQGKLKDRAKGVITDALGGMSQIVSPEPLVQVLQMDTLLRTHSIAARESAQAIESDSATNESQKNALYAKLRQAPLARQPQRARRSRCSR